MTDQDIVYALRNGDTKALRFCYDKAFGMVKAMVLKNSGTADMARDIFHDALLVFHKNCLSERFELTSSLSTYLYGISWRLWLKELKQPMKYDELSGNELIESFDFELSYKSVDERVSELMLIIDKLGKNCVEILKGYYFLQLSYDQIALQLSYGSGQVVREQKYRCLKRVRNSIKNE